jgi:hypothetical protein
MMPPRRGQFDMSETEQRGPTLVALDDPHAPDVFTTGAAGFTRLGPNISIALETLRVSHAPPQVVNRVVIGRLVIAAEDARRFAYALNDFLRSQGLDPDDLRVA